MCALPVCADIRMYNNSETKIVDIEVVFKVNRWEMLPSDSMLYAIDSVIIPMLNSREWHLDHVEVRGAASPEGPLVWNEILARNRKDAIIAFVQERIPPRYLLDTTIVSKQTEVAEDYELLVERMTECGDPDLRLVKRAIREAMGDMYWTKKNIKAIRDGETWQRLLQTYYPRLRASKMTFFLSKIDIGAEHDPLAIEPYDSVPHIWLEEIADTTMANRRAVINIKTNLLLDFAYVHHYGMAWILNAQLEYYPKHGHITPVISFDGPWWQYESAKHKYFQVRNYQAEVRYYFRKEDARFDGWYAGIYGHGMLYGVGFNGGEGYQGEGGGLGLTGGYVLPLIRGYKHIKLEFGIQVGWFTTKYDPYVYGCPVEKVEDGLYYYDWTGKADDFIPRQYRWNWFGPTRIGITFSYDLLYRKNNKKGASFRWREKREAPSLHYEIRTE